MLGVFFAGAGFGTALNSVMRTQYGTLLEPHRSHVYDLGQALPFDFRKPEFRLESAWICVGAVGRGLPCLLVRRVRPFEVVK